MTHDMTIKALAPWFGGKRTLAPVIVQELGSHSQYFELFCGSCAVLFAKEPTQKETVNDLHGDLINLARVIANRDMAEEMYDQLQRVVFSEGMLIEARQELEKSQPPEPPLYDFNRAFWYFLASWMGRNGTAGTDRIDYQIAVRWTKNGGSPTVRFRNAVESLPAWHRRLLNVVIIKRDALQIADRFEDVKETAIYADPPYPSQTRSNMGDNGGGGGRYLHEFAHGGSGLFAGDNDDHARLAAKLTRYKHARVVVSSYDNEQYRELYKGWTFVQKPMLKLLHQQNGRGNREQEAPEVLIINGPSYTEKSA